MKFDRALRHRFWERYAAPSHDGVSLMYRAEFDALLDEIEKATADQIAEGNAAAANSRTAASGARIA